MFRGRGRVFTLPGQKWHTALYMRGQLPCGRVPPFFVIMHLPPDFLSVPALGRLAVKSGCGLLPAKMRLAAACGKPNALLAPPLGWVSTSIDGGKLKKTFFPARTTGRCKIWIFPAPFSSPRFTFWSRDSSVRVSRLRIPRNAPTLRFKAVARVLPPKDPHTAVYASKRRSFLHLLSTSKPVQ